MISAGSFDMRPSDSPAISENMVPATLNAVRKLLPTSRNCAHPRPSGTPAEPGRPMLIRPDEHRIGASRQGVPCTPVLGTHRIIATKTLPAKAQDWVCPDAPPYPLILR